MSTEGTPLVLDSGVQSHLLADSSTEARVAQIVASAGYECVLCYAATREAQVSGPRAPRPSRMRYLADVQKQCRTCPRTTFWCTAGPWIPGKRAAKPQV